MSNREKKEKKESKLKSKIKELKKTTRGKAILKLIRWGIFFLCLFLFMFISSLISQNAKPTRNDIPKIPEEEPIKIEAKEVVKDLGKKLMESSYHYEFDINIDTNRIIYNGTKDNEKDMGYKESSIGIIKYLIDYTGTYDITKEKVAITNLYENINIDYLTISKIMNLIENKELTKDLECDCIYPVYKTNIEDIEISFSLQDELEKENNNISSISIESPNFSYHLIFSDIKDGTN